MTRFVRLLMVFLIIAAIASAVAVRPRLVYDAAQGDRVALAANLGDIAMLADSQGLPVADVLAGLAAAGLTSVVAGPDYLAAVEEERGNVFPGPGAPPGAEWMPLLPGPPGQAAADLTMLFAEVSGRVAGGVLIGPVILAGPNAPGYPDALEVTARHILDLGLRLGLVEDPSQLGYVPLPGTARLAELTGYSVVRVYRQPAAALYSPERITEKTVRSVKDRNLRVVWLDLFTFPGAVPAAWTTHPGGGTGPLAASLHYVESVRRSLEAAGFEVGRSRAGFAGPEEWSGQGSPPGAGRPALAAIALGPWAASLLGFDLIARRRLAARACASAASAAVGLGLAGAFWWALGQAPVASRQVMALWAALAYPSAALLWIIDHWSRAGHQSPFRWSTALSQVLAPAMLSLLGGLAVSGLLADPRFATEISYFRGVKLSYVVPPAVALVGGVWLLLGRVARVPAGDAVRRAVREVRRFAVRDVEVWHVLAGLAGLAAAVVYVGRSGDQPWLPVSDFEVTVRAWLDRAFYAQPRVKEFLVGYPALAIGSFLAWAGRRAWLPLWAAAGGVGLVSIVNSFEHVRTPVVLTLVRTLNGAWLGLFVGLVGVAVAGRLVRRPSEAGRDSAEPAPGGATGGAGARMPAPRRLDVLGTGFDRVTQAQALHRAIDLVRDAAQGGGEARLIVTPNPEMVVQAWNDAGLHAALASADLCVPDGIGVVWASGVLGPALPERVAGFDLLTAVFARAAEVWDDGRPLRVYLLGGKPGVAESAARVIESAYPGVAVVGLHHGYFPGDAGPVDAIRDAAPDLLCVGMGSPRQELWLSRHRRALAGMAAIGVGGALDVLSGRARRAPAWVRSLGLEWLYRIMSEPGERLGRAPALARFALAVAREAARRRLGLGRGR
ncbi:MAG: glycosyltransferase [Bacillota bacterium]|nr:MAG: glycosyltransferase [Bacillota bacterium]